jgi:paraquat-inducible protein B
MKYTDYTQVRQLAKNILLDDRKMVELTGDLEQQLKALEGTFLDDGIEDVRSTVKTLTSKLKNAQAAFKTVAGELAEYANILQAGKI